MDNKTIGIAIGAVALYMLLNKRNSNQAPPQQYVPQYSYVPPQPPRSNAQAWSQWVQAIVGTYGTVAQLWQPGGPFYNQPVTQQQAQQIATNFAQGVSFFP